MSQGDRSGERRMVPTRIQRSQTCLGAEATGGPWGPAAASSCESFTRTEIVPTRARAQAGGRPLPGHGTNGWGRPPSSSTPPGSPPSGPGTGGAGRNGFLLGCLWEAEGPPAHSVAFPTSGALILGPPLGWGVRGWGEVG